MQVKGNHPLAEIIACKLSGIGTVPKEYVSKMISTACREAVKYHEMEICKLQAERELFEKLPDNLMLARNSNAPEFDRWRIHNYTSNETLEKTGSHTATQCVQKYTELEEIQRKKWVGESK